MKKIIGLFIIYMCFISNVFAHDVRFVQVADVRYSEKDNSQKLTQVVKDINTIRNVDFVVFTGDNINKANPNDLKSFLKEAKKLKYPFYMVVGDKDVNKHKDLSKKQYAKIAKKHLALSKDGYVNYVFEKRGLVFLVVDGARDVIPSSNGYYKDCVISWVDSKLNLYSAKNVIILQHFPLVPPENRENYITLKPEKYLEMLHRNNNVKAVISGHFGVNKEVLDGGINHISTAPAPNYRIIDITDCTSSNPTIWAELKEAE